MLISFIGFLENAFNANENRLQSAKMLTLVFSLILGTFIGEALQIFLKATATKLTK